MQIEHENDNTAARELQLFAENVDAYISPVLRTLSRKHRAGVFEFGRAVDYVDRYCLTPAAKQYRREFCGMRDHWADVFPKHVRQAAAECIVRQAVAEFKLGNYYG